MTTANKIDINNKVIANFTKVKFTYLIPPFLVLLICFSLPFLLKPENNFVEGYIGMQKELFYYLNATLSTYPSLQYNLSQLGDVILLFPFVSIFILYAPKLWEAIITSSMLSLVVSAVLKMVFSVPRPAAIFDNDSFTIIGRTLTGHSSLPSGHSMTCFIVITLLMLAFIPKKNSHKAFWCLFMTSLGLVITCSRVGVGAHFPLDVVIGCSIGCVLAIIGIQLNKKLNWMSKLKNKYQTLMLIAIILIWMVLVIQKIAIKNLFITYLSFSALLITLYLTSKSYVQKNY